MSTPTKKQQNQLSASSRTSQASGSSAPLPASLNFRLSMMMFLQYAIWGAWMPLLYPYLTHLQFNAGQIGNMFAVGALGAIFAPFVAGQIADRYFATEKFLAVSHILGGILIWQLAELDQYWHFLVFSLIYSLVYSPTLSLTNAVAFHHVPDRDRDFGRVRLWGTIGWIAVGITIGHWLLHMHTPTNEEAASSIVKNQLLDHDMQHRLLDDSRVTLNSGEIVTGYVEESDGQVTVEVATTTNGSTKIETKTFKKDEVESIVPLYATLAAEGKADEILQIIRDLDAKAHGGEGGTESPEQLVTASMLSTEALNEVKQSANRAGIADAFRLSAILGILMGLYCITLPHTPPARGQQNNAAMEALSEIRKNPLLTLFLVAVPISCIHQFYFVHASNFLGTYQARAEGADSLVEFFNSIFGVGGAGLMTIGQMSEIAVLALIPLVAKKFSRKSLLMVGTLAYAARMALFAYVDVIPLPPLVTMIVGVALHGLCFGCFIFVAFMIVDEETTGDVRNSAQSLFNLVIVGIGIIVGSKIAASVAEWATITGTTLNYTKLFMVPMWAALACALVLLLFYPARHVPRAPD